LTETEEMVEKVLKVQLEGNLFFHSIIDMKKQVKDIKGKEEALQKEKIELESTKFLLTCKRE
jgi:hypothetical protein